MKILLLSWEYPPRIIGGLARHVYHLSNELAKLGNEVFVITLDFPNTSYEEHIGNLHIYRVKVELASYDFLTWCFSFNHFFEKKIGMIGSNFDLIHAHDWLVAPCSISIKHLLHKPLLATMHSLEIGRVGSLTNPLSIVIDNLEWWLTYESKYLITTSSFMKNQLIEHFKLPENKIFVISNGVNLEEFEIEVDKKEIKRNLGFDENSKLISFVGRITEQKGVKYFVESIPMILNSNRDARFLIVGDGWQLEEIKNLITRYGLNWAVKITGYVDDSFLKKLIKASEILVIPSIYEPFGIVALEAMASGVAVAASDTGGLSEIIENGIDGIKVPPRDPKAIANAVNYLLNDESLYKKIVQNAKKKVLKYSWREIAKRTYEVYEKVMSGV